MTTIPSTTARWFRRTYAVPLCLVGILLVAGGMVLAVEGGSPYYLFAGLAVVAAAVLIWRGDPRGPWLYAAMLVGTIAWSVWEVGSDPWGLMARLLAPFVLGLPMLLPAIPKAQPRVAGGRRSFPAGAGWAAFVGALGAAVIVGAGLNAIGPARPADPAWRTGARTSAPGRVARSMASPANGEWLHYGNDEGGTRFSPLDQITAANVGGLKVAWEADTGPALPGPTAGLEVTPIMAGDALYVCNGYDAVISYDAEDGHELWRHLMDGEGKRQGKPCRGVSYLKVPGATGACAERIFAASQAPDLVALDARTGRPCEGFGTGGRISLMNGISPVSFGIYYVSSAPQVVRGKVVVGGGIIDGQRWGDPSGVIRAFDAVTGQLAWAYDPGHLDRTGAPPAGEYYTPSSPNSWAPISADDELGLVYMPMGGATPDNYGGQRRPFDDAIGSSVLALDVETGRPRWSFQTTHHDLWDYDVPSQPTLVDLPKAGGGVTKALIQPTKRGEIFVLDRETGKPIRSVEERLVPQGGTAPGERLSPTQPFSVALPGFRGPRLRERDMWGATPLDQMVCRIKFRTSRYDGPFTPPTLDTTTITDPGYGGGVDWGSVSVDPDRGLMVVNWLRLPTRITLITREEGLKRGFHTFDGHGPVPSGDAPMMNTPYASIGDAFLSPIGTPCAPPPWGLISAVDLANGRVVWSQPFGDTRDTGPFGIASHVPLPMGVPFSGGSVTTRGGLVFIAASVEQAIRAYDASSGRELWKARLPAGGQATPMTYRAPRSGRQMVVVAAGGKPTLETKQGTRLVAYALTR